jgi:rubredoxin
VDFSIKRSCPKCGSEELKLVGSRDQFNLMDPLGEQSPVSKMASYQCDCGHAFAEATPHAGDSTPPKKSE